MHRLRDIETVDDNKLDTDRWDSVNTDAQYSDNREGVLDKLVEISRNVGRSKHRIELTAPATLPINTAPYHSR